MNQYIIKVVFQRMYELQELRMSLLVVGHDSKESFEVSDNFKGIGLDTLSQMYHIFSETCMVIIYDRFVLYELGKKLMSRNLDGNSVWFSSYSIFCSHCEQLFVCMLYARLVSLLNGLIPKGRQAEDERAVIRQLRKMRVKFSLHGPRN